MPSKEELNEARSEAAAILAMRDEDIAQFFFQKCMRRNLGRLVRHLDRLVLIGGEDRVLGEKALNRLGFETEG